MIRVTFNGVPQTRMMSKPDLTDGAAKLKSWRVLLRRRLILERRQTLHLGIAHFVNDMYASVVPPLVPLFLTMFGLTYALAGMIVVLHQLTFSFGQLFFGYLFDRLVKPWLAPLGMLVGGLAISLVGLVDQYVTLLLLVALGGVGSALFHPAAMSMSSFPNSRRQNLLFSLYMMGGNLGVAFGPLITLFVVGWFGVNGTTLLAIPSIVTFLIMMRVGWWVGHIREEGRTRQPIASVLKRLKPVSPIFAAGVLRAAVYQSLFVFLPAYGVLLGMDIEAAGALLTMLLAAGTVGNIVGSHLADRLGITRVASAALIISGPAILLLVLAGTPFKWIAVAVLGGALLAAHSSTIILTHRFLPLNVGLASGIALGAATGVGSIGVSAVGILIDILGFGMAFALLAPLPLLAGVLIILAGRAAATRH